MAKTKKKKNKLIIPITLTIIISLPFIFTIETKQDYETITPTVKTITEKIEFSAPLYPNQYAYIDLGNQDNIKEAYVKEGDTVKKEDILVQLDDSAEQEQYKAAQSAYYSYANMRNQAKEAEENINDSTSNNDIDYDETIDAITNSNLPDEQKTSLIALISSQQPQSDLIASLSSISISTSSIQPMINNAYAQMQMIEDQLKEKQIKAPFDGTVLAISTNRYEASSSGGFDMSSFATMSMPTDLEGMLSPQPSSSTFTPHEGNYIILADTSSYFLYPQLTSSEIVKIKEGQEVTIRISDLDIVTNGKIEKVYNIPTQLGAENPLYYVKISVPIDQNLPLGITTTGEILIKQKDNTVTIPSDIIEINENLKPSIKILNNGKVIPLEIETGIQDATNIEIAALYDNNGNEIEVTDTLQIVIKEKKPKKVIKLRSWLQH